MSSAIFISREANEVLARMPEEKKKSPSYLLLVVLRRMEGGIIVYCGKWVSISYWKHFFTEKNVFLSLSIYKRERLEWAKFPIEMAAVINHWSALLRPQVVALHSLEGSKHSKIFFQLFLVVFFQRTFFRAILFRIFLIYIGWL